MSLSCSRSTKHVAFCAALVLFPGGALAQPGAPTSLIATAGNAQVTLGWEDPGVASINAYRYRQSTDGGTTFGAFTTIADSNTNTTSYVVDQLANSTAYTFKIQAQNADGWSNSSNEATATPQPPPPAAPTSLTATVGNTQLTLDWSNPGDASISAYRYRQSSDGGTTFGAFIPITGSGADTTSYVFTGLTNGTSYTFEIQAQNAGGWSDSSEQITTTPISPPGGPKNLVATAGNAQVIFGWTDPSDTTIIAYRYRQSTDGGTTFGAFTTITGSGANTTSHVATGLTNGTDYKFEIQAQNGGGWSGSSNQATATPIAPPGAPMSPTATVGNTRVTLNWTDPSDTSISAYRYRQSADGGATFGAFTTITGSSANTTSYVVTGLTNGTTYTFEIQAQNAAGWGGSSNRATATPIIPTSLPTGIAATAGNAQVTLGWSNPNDSSISAYQYRQSTDGGTTFGGFTPITGSGANTTNHVVTGLTNGIAYTFEIQALRSSGWSGSSNQATATPIAPPGAPTSLNGTTGNEQVTLAWADPSNTSISAYRYRQSTDGGTTFGAFTSITGLDANTTSYVITGLTNGTAYTFEIQAQSAGGWSGSSNQATATPIATPGAPTSLTATTGNAQVTLGWADPGDTSISAYWYRQSTDGGVSFGEFTTITGSGANSTSHVVTGLTNSTAYTFEIRAQRSLSWSDSSNQATATPIATPGAPTSLTATAGNGIVILDWADPSDTSINAYRYRHSTDGGTTFGAFTTITGSGANTTNHVVAGIINGTAYTFEIQAQNAGGWSGSSNEATATPISPPGAPTNLAATASNAQVALDWADPGDTTIIAYRYRQSTDGGTTFGAFTTITGSGANTTSHVVTGLTNGTAYTFEIQAQNAVGWSGLSNRATATPIIPTSLPTGLTTTAGNAQVTLDWLDPNDSSISAYRYRQSINGGTTFGAFTTITGSGANTTNHVVTGLTNGTAYTFEIQALRASGWSGSSNQATATPIAPPGAPTNLTATAGNAQVTLGWADPSDTTIIAYRYRQSTDGGTTFGAFTTITGSGANTTSHVVTGLTNGTTYTFENQAQSAGGWSGSSDPATATPQWLAPFEPRYLIANPGNAQVTLGWADPSDTSISAYRYRQSTDGGTTFGAFTTITGSGANTTSHVVAGLTNGTAYTFEIQAQNAGGWSGSSDPVTVTPQRPPPGTPTNLTATAGNAQMTLGWADPSDTNISAYRYRQSTDGGTTFGAFTTITGSGANTTSHVVTGLTNGTDYTFIIQAQNAGGWSNSSNEATKTPITPPSAPQNLIATPGNAQVILNWSDPGDTSINAYRYRQSTDGGTMFGAFTTITGSGANTMSYVVTGLTNDTAYTFEIQAQNASGWSGSSNQTTATPIAPPGAPQSLTATAGNAKVTLDWVDPSDASISAYRYRYSTNGGTTFGQFTPISGSGADTTRHVVDQLINDNAYTFEIQAQNAGGWSGSSNQATATPVASPSAPTSLTATAGNAQVTLDWADPGDTSISAYRYRQSTDGGSTFGAFTTITGSDANTTSHVVTGLTNGTPYTFEIQALRSLNWSGSSNQATTTPIAPPGTPQNLTATAGNAQVTLGWTDPGDTSISAYRYRYSTNGGTTFGPFMPISGSGANTTRHVVDQLINDTAYTFEIQAQNAGGWSGSSDPVTATPIAPPGAPTSLTATAGNAQVTLNWADPNDTSISAYQYRQSTDGGTTFGAFTTITGSNANTTSHVITGLTNGTVYTFKIQAQNAGGWSNSSNEATATPQPPAPGAPTNLTATAGNAQVTLGWADPGDTSISAYRYRQSTNGGASFGSFMPILGSGANTTSYVVTELTNGTTYTFEIQAQNAGGWSGLSERATATPTAPPVAPTRLTATVGNTQVILGWADPGDTSISAYRYRQITDGGTTFGAFTTITGSGANTTSHVVTGLTNGTAYTFEIQAQNAGGWSGSSNQATATPIAPPGAPTNLAATAGNAQVTLNWANPGDTTISAYRYRQSTDGGTAFGLFTTITGSGANTTSHVVTGLTNGTAYTFEIQAQNVLGWSGLSNRATATPIIPTPLPTGLTATAGNAQVTLDWSDPNDSSISAYRYRYSTNGGTTFGLFTTITGSGANTTSYVVTGLTNGTAYTFEIQAFRASGWSGSSNRATATPIAPPGAPQSLTATTGNAQVILGWADPSNTSISAYRYRHSTDSGESFGVFTTITGSGANTTYHVVTGLTNGTTYTFEIQAQSAGGWSGSSDPATATPIAPTGAPTSFTATAGNAQVTLNWADPGDTSISAYQYRQSTDGGVTFGLFTTITGSSANTTSYVVTGLTNGTAYTFEIQAFRASGWSGSSNQATATPIAPPGVPQSLTATAGNGIAILDWADPGDTSISAYRYRQSTDGGTTFGPFMQITGSGANTTNYVVAGLINGTAYTFEIQAQNAGGWSGSSNQATAVPQPPPPGAPQSLTATAGNARVTLGWADPSDTGINAYRYRQSTDGGTTFGAFTTITGSSTNTTSHVVTGLTNGTAYTFEIQAQNAGGWSDSSNQAIAAPIAPSGVPTNLTATAGNAQVSLDWSDPNDISISVYRYRQSTNGGTTFGPFMQITGSGANTTNHAVTGLTNGTAYTFEIQAFRSVGWSGSSNQATAIPIAPPGSPTSLTATASNTQVTLGWADPGDTSVNAYRYRHSTDGGTTFGAYTIIAGSSANTTSHVIGQLNNGTAYTFEIQAQNAGGWSGLSNQATATPQRPPPFEPQSLTASAGDTQVTLGWADPGDSSISAYRYRQSTDGGTTFGAFTTITGSGANTTSHVVTGLTNGTTYTFEIQARNAGGWSGSSNQVDATPQRSPPGAPTSLTATVGNAQVPLGWADPSDSSISAYRYRQSTDGGTTFGAFMTIMGSGANTTSHVVDQLTNGTAYTFIIQAQNAGGWSNSSNDATATPERPSGITLSVNPTSVAEEDEATDVTVTATVNGNTTYREDQTVTVAVGAEDDAAKEETDYALVDDITITIPAGAASATGTFSLDPTGDVIDEGDSETLSVEGSAASGVTVAETMVTITDNDATPSGITLSVNRTSVAEEADATNVTVTATVNGTTTYAAEQTVTVVVGAQNDEATEGTDYALVDDITITIPAGAASATGTFSLDPTEDMTDEGDGETLSVEGSAASEVSVTGAVVTITDDDVAPAVPVNFQATAGDARVTLTWDTANDDTITRWEYQQKQGTGGTYGAWTSITNSDADTTAHALENLTNGTKYFFRLRAVNATGNGASSGEQSATPAAGNNPPTVQNPLADLTLVAGTTQDVDVSGTFDDHDGINDTLTYTANSDDTSVATVSLSGTTLTVSGVAAGDTTVTVSASDNSASASDTFEVTVETDTQPVLAAITDQSYTRGVEIEALPLPSSSTGNGPLTYSLSPALPAGLSFDATTRTLSGTPTGLQAATSYTYKVVDANADEATQSFNITVLAPLPAAPVNFQATAGDARVTLTWGTANDNTISSWEYQQKQGMGGTYGAWTSIANSDADTTAHARENLTNDTQYTFQLRAVNATGNGASSAGQSATPTAGNNPPTVQNRLADLTLIAGTTQDVDVSGTFDDHDDDTLTYTASPADTSVATVSLSGTTLTVSGVAAGDTTVTVSASDNSASASDTFAVKVETDTQPVLAAIADQSYTRGVEIAALTLPSSSTGNGPLTYSLSPALPAGLSFDAATRTLSGTPTGLQAATSYTYKVVDANADEATQSFNITVLAPLPAAPVNFQATAGDARVTLTWNTANDDTISSWEYQQKQGMGGTYGAWTSIANSDADTTAHARENLTNDTQYTFQLRAVNATGNGASSAGQSATPTAGNNPPTVQNRLADLTLIAGTTQDVDVSGTFDDHDDDTLTYTASPADTSVATVSLSGTTLTVSGVAAGDTTVTVSASDNSASASDTFAVKVETDTQPVLAAIADQSYTRGVEIAALTLPSSSTGNGPLTYSLSPALPAGLSFDAATRTLSGTPTGLQAATSYTYKVVDANADEATQSFNITVLAPLPAAPVNFQATAGDARVTLTWNTANDDTISSWEYQQKQGMGGTYGAWTSIANSDADTTAHARENLTNDTQYTFQLRAVNATGNGASSAGQSATPTAGNNPPTVQNRLADLTLIAGTTQDVDVSGTFDDHDDDTLTYTASPADTSVATVSLSGTTLTVSGVAAGDTTVTVSASDNSASASDTFAVKVETDTQPVLAAIADQSYTRGVEIAALTLPSSSTGNGPLTYSLSPALPAGLSFDAATRTLSGTPTGLQAATSYTYKVVDANADEATQSFNITVLAPLPAAPVNFQATAGDARVTLTWNTANDDTISRWEYQQKQGMGGTYGAWTSIANSDADTTAHARENLTNDTQYTFQLRAVNATGNGASSAGQSATPTAGNNPPTVQNRLADLTLIAGTTQDVDVSGTFDDHDDDTLTYTASPADTSVATVSLSGTTLTVSGVAAGDTTVTVSASDNSASASDTFAVKVETDTQPVLAAIADQSYTRGVEIAALTLPSSSTGNGPLTYSLSPALPAGLSFDAATRTLSGTPTGLQAATSYTYKVVDANADEATQSFNITVLAPLPAAPVNFQATAGDARVTLTWNTANDDTISSWEYQQKQGMGGTYGAWTSIANSDADTTAHARENLTNDTQYTFQLRAVNATGNGASSAGQSATPTAGNNPPTVQNRLADLTLIAGTTQDVDVSGTFDDHDDDTLTYTASPADTSVATVSLSGTTLTVSGVAAGDTTVTVSASDNSASASDTFAVKVETDTQPVLAAIADQSYTRGVEIAALTLPSSSTGNGPLTYSLSPALPAGLSFDAATRTLSGTPTGLQAATSYTYKVVDANADEATQSFNITVLAPLPAAPVNFQATAGDARVTLTWNTANDDTISSWEYQQKQGMGGTYGAWTSIANSDADTTAHARENLTNDTQYTFQLRAVNATGNGASSAGQSATPTAGNNPPTVQNRLADLTLIAGTTQDVDVSGTFDDHDDDTLTYTASPADTSVATVSLSGTTLTVSGVAAGDTTVTVSASDNSASASDTFAVKVETDTQPVLAAIADQSYTRGVEIAALTLPSSSTGNGPLTYSLSPALPAGLSFDAATRTLSGTPTGLQAATSYTYKVVDANADEATQSFNITVLAPLPAAPVNFQATAGDARVTLTWNTANDDTISSWEYQQKQGMGGTYGAWTSIANSDADTTAHARENLTNDTQYTFQLRAVNATGNGASSAGQSATPTAGNNPPTVQNRLADLTLIAGTTQDVDVSGTFDDHDDDTLTYTASPADTSVATVSLSGTTLTVSGVAAGDTTVTVSASDNSASASDTFAVKVETDTQPVLAAIADQSYTRGVEIAALTLPSSSTGNGPLTYSLSPALPAGLSFDAATRTLSGTPTGLQAATSYTYKVVDANADEATQSFNITVLAPLPAAPVNFQATAGDARVTLTWNTANDDTISSWEYQQKQGMGGTYGAWTSIANSDADTTAHARENLTNDTQYTFQLRAVNATGNGASSAGQSATPTAGNNPPTVQNRLADLTLIAGTTQDVDVSGTFDDHDDDTLTYTASPADTSVATVSLSGTTLTVSGVAAGDTTVTVSASDNSASASDTFAVKVETDTQPVLAAIADQSYTRGVEIAALTLPSSSTGNGPLTYSLSPALPAGLSFDAATRTLSGTPTGLQAATSYTYKVVDANADEATQSFNITVLAPLPAAPVNFQATAGDARVTLTWNTANDDTISSWEYQQKQGMGGTYGAWTSIANSDADTTAHARENLTNDTQYTFQLRAVNATGNGASSAGQSATPTAGNNPPTVQNRLADLTLIAGTTQDVDVSGTFDDHDDDTLTYTASPADTSVATVSLSGTTLTVSGVAAGDTTVTVSASDNSASASDTFAVKVETDTQPVLAAIADQSYTRGVEIAALTLPSSSTGNGPLTYSLSPALPAGLSFDAATRTLSGTPTGLQAATSYTYKVVDANADEATQSFNITVLAPLPAAPVNFQATAGDARVTLTWNTANDDTISSWEYQQKQGMGGTYGAWTSIANSDADTTAHARENLTNDTQYTFQLRAVNATGNGASSAGQSATPTAGNNPPTVQNRLADLTLIAGTTQDVDVSGTFDDHDDDTLTYTASPADTSVATVSLSGTTLTVSGVAAGDTTVTVSASDNSASASDTFAVKVETDTQPVLAAIADQSYMRGVEIAALTLPSSSTGNGQLTYSLSPALPAGLSFDAATRTLSGTPTGLQAATSYTYKVVDANADEATQSFNITVLTPLPSAPVNFQATAGDARVTLTWNTANDDTITRWEYQQKQGMGDYGAWTSITNSDADTTAHALESLTNDTQYTFQLRAVNATGNGASSGELSVTPTAGNNPPTVQNRLADLTLVAGATLVVDVSGTFDDHDGINDTLTYTASSANTSVATVSLSGTTLTVSSVAAGATTVTVSATDNASASASDTFAVTVETNTQPGLAAIADQSYTRGVEIAALTLPSSSTGNGPLNYSLSPELPADLSFDAATRMLSGTPTELQASTSYTYKVVDADEDMATQSFNITVRERLFQPEQFSQKILEGMLAVTARSMGESAQTAIEGRFEQYRQWSQEATGESVLTSQPWRENSPTTLSPGESERIVGEGAGGRGAEGSLVQSHWGAANSSTAMGAGWKSENRETGTPGSRLRSLSLGSLGDVAHSDRTHSGASPGSGMEPSGSVYGQDRQYGSGVDDAPLGPGSTDMSGMRVEELRLSEISFEMSLGDSEKETSWVPVLWGQGDMQHFKGNLARFGMDYQGDLEAAHVGLDLYANNQMLAGLSFMRSLGDMEYTDDGIDRVLESRMHTVHPYLYWQPTERLSVWGIGGLGTGQVEVREPGQTHDFDTNFRMFAAGVRAVLVRRGNNEWGLRADAFSAQLETDALEGIAKINGEAHRGRLMLEWVHNTALSAGRSMSMQMEAGGRFDGGDADRGSGAETGVRLGYLNANSGLDVALHGRLLVVHESDYQDWGMGVQASWDPGEKQRGLRASVMSSWGQDGGGQITLWDNADAVMRTAGMDALGTSSQYRMEIDVAYGDGMKSLGLPGLLTPYSRLRWTGQGRELSLGTEWSLPARSRQSLPSTLKLEVTRQENKTGPADLAVLARLSISF